MAGIRDRPTGELLILMIAGTVCLFVLVFGGVVGVLAISDPTLDLAAASRAVGGIINTLLGLMAGFLVGRGRDRPPS